ncbi:hypothetical protein DEO72_LG4g527 [Vigna unguiculata]|uniref:Uncharacterized protein n=1 Tax=Vigna unguiculata TaxID=3917 RepID=A0A4D6LLW4_VIGUN|nr:hypothetical protein DEO72_LG4g527 [Vigna unguiculata]
MVSVGFRIYDAHTNLLARGLASTNPPTRSPSTNLLARSPALRIWPPVVRHM